jgi:hypothetical protein
MTRSVGEARCDVVDVNEEKRKRVEVEEERPLRWCSVNYFVEFTLSPPS